MEMNLKQSEYNFIYDDLGKDQIVMYNSFTGALAVIKEQQYKQFTDYLETGKEIEDKVFLENALTNQQKHLIFVKVSLIHNQSQSVYRSPYD